MNDGFLSPLNVAGNFAVSTYCTRGLHLPFIELMVESADALDSTHLLS